MKRADPMTKQQEEPCHDCGAMVPLAEYAAHVRVCGRPQSPPPPEFSGEAVDFHFAQCGQPLSPPEAAKAPTLLHEMNPPNPWQPERDPIALAVLGKLAEELSEAGAIVARCIIQGIKEAEPVTGKPNADALEDELSDALAMIEVCIEYYGLHRLRMNRRRDRKIAHVTTWHRLIEEPSAEVK